MELAVTFAMAMSLSAMSGRITLLATRGGISRPLNGLNAVRDVIGLIAGLCFWVLIIWGFLNLNWYIALPVILVGAFFGGLVVNQSSFAFFHRFEWLLDLIVLSLTGWLWSTYWPF